MKGKILFLVFSIWLPVHLLCQNNGWIDIRTKGAKIDGSELCTGIIQDAIDKAAIAGGGVIYFPSGTYLTGAIHFKSNITLHLDAGAILKFSDNPNDYLPLVPVRWEGVMMNSFSPLLHADNVDNISIEGRGLLDGQGKKWWETSLGFISEIRKNGDLSELNEYQTMWEAANKDIVVSDYYKNTLKRRFFRPPFFQSQNSRNIRISGVKFINSPFWTINPEFCDNITIDGVTIMNPISPNTDGINPSSCSNVHISNCHISVGDDCITIKSGRDAEGRKFATPCQNITITNCTMLNGHGGVVIGSEMSGDVRKVTISNCVFDGTDRGIRLKSSRERGGIVEEIRVSNIVMKNIRNQAFVFNLLYDKSLPEGPVSEKTPIFRNIHISNVTGSEIKNAGDIIGIAEMPVENISFNNINIDAENGFSITRAHDIEFINVTVNAKNGSAFSAENSHSIVFNGVKSGNSLKNVPVIELNNTYNVFIFNCLQLKPVDLFLKVSGEKSKNIQLWNNNLVNAKTVVDAPKGSVTNK